MKLRLTRRTAMIGAAGVVVVVVAGVVLFVLVDRGSAPPPLDVPRAERQARAACAGLVTFERQVDENASSDKVLATLHEASRQANDAADRDPRWRSLASGTDALEVAIERNDGAAARIGIDVVRAQCADAT